MDKEARAIKEFVRKLKGNIFDKVKPMKDSTKAWNELSKREINKKSDLAQYRHLKKSYGK